MTVGTQVEIVSVLKNGGAGTELVAGPEGRVVGTEGGLIGGGMTLLDGLVGA